MTRLLRVNILAPDKTLYDADAYSLIVPAEFGYLGVLADHAPLIASLVPGNITIGEESGRRVVLDSRSKGFLEVLENQATIILDSAK